MPIFSSVVAPTKCDLLINEACEGVLHLNISSEQTSVEWKKSELLYSLCGLGVKRKKTETQIITMPTTSDTTRAEPKNFLIHLNVKATFAALPPCESPQAAKRPVVSHLFTPAAAGCHWDSEGEIP